ncbi:putative ABC transport system ATP-binding protein [Pilibacter termitis]|uniref:Putative ABC transport system ATP-binding protein n=1 Tax=Pilibacter termitis TaxID=263852 RepID=A0A1T4QA99_9ENTE|nr:ABC transporter ATP-binding protein [Pilibacter termitis]SKA00451.1 putative ABC transport system ATP-binding protein [Pilibacter termitis]
MSFIEVKDIVKKYQVGEVEIIANDQVSFSIEEGEFVVILGPSGAGKSTVLNILGGMDSSDAGNIFIDNRDITKLNERELTTYRREDVGFVFQFYNLVPNLTAKENVELASQIVTNAMDAEEVLALCGLAHRKDNFIAQLSGGEQQRVTIARAVAKRPKVLLCDEPTGALDSKTGKMILKLLMDICKKTNTTVIVITHNSVIAEAADRVITIRDAKVENVRTNQQPKKVEDIEI